MTRLVFVLGVMLAACAAPAAFAGAVSLSDALVDRMRGAQVVILGEVHDNPAHHRVQAAAVAALAPRAVVWEMLTAQVAARLTPELIADPAALAQATDWDASGWPPLEMYLPVFRAAPGAAQLGALVPRSVARAVMETGAVAGFGEDAARYGLADPLPSVEQAARENDQLSAHCDALPQEMLPMMVEIQRLRDAELARAALRALEQTGGPVVVITGNGHARADRGVPVYLRRAAPGVAVFALGQSEAGQVSGTFDAVLDGPATDRPDPCAAFSKPG